MFFPKGVRSCPCCRAVAIASTSRRHFVFAAGASLVAGTACAGALTQAAAAPASGTAGYDKVVRQVLERHPMAGGVELVMNEVTYPPGVAAPVHHHPVAALNYILEGTAESAYADDKPQVYHAGQTLQDKPDVPHTLFRNLDRQRPLRFLNVYVLEPGRTFTIVP